MSTPLLKTKLYVPSTRPRLVQRPRLIERLNDGLCQGNRLTLVSAPAGYGKTTLLGTWIAGSELRPRVAWLSLDEDDNEEARFWSYVIVALQGVWPGSDGEAFAQSALELLQLPQQPPIDGILTMVLNELSDSSERAILVLDDYHVINTPAIHRGLAFLLQHPLPQLHLVLATRADPPLALARLRARGQLTELRANDLRFTAAETATLLNEMMQLGLPAEDVTALETRTEGWIVGLQLAALALQDRTDSKAFVAAFTGGHHYILEYLAEEVLRRQPPGIQRFLLQTSILDRMSVSLCDAVCAPLDDAPTATGSARNNLTYLLTTNLFIVPLDDERVWYRYHHLFAGLLRNLLHQAYADVDVQALHRRASEWHEANADVNAAIKYAIQAEDYDRAAGLMEQAFAAAISRGSITTMLHWTDALPEGILTDHPRLSMYRGWAMFLNGQYVECERRLLSASEWLDTQPATPETDAMRGELGSFLATMATVHQDTAEAIKQAQLSLRHLPDGNLAARARSTRALGIAYGQQSETDKLIETCREAKGLALEGGNRLLASEVMSQIAFMRYHKGQLRESAREYQEILNLTPRPQSFPWASLGHIGLALVKLEWNELQAVEEHLDRGIELSHRGGIGYMLRTAFCLRAIQRQAQGDGEGALAMMRKAHELPWLPGLSEIPVLLLQYRVRLHLLRGEISAAGKWVTGEAFDHPVTLEGLTPVLDEIVQHAQARVALAQNDGAHVLAICERVMPQAQAAGRMARVIEFALLKALALHTMKQPDAALEALEQCLALAEPEHYRRLFIEAGSSLPGLLQAAVRRGVQPDIARELLEVIGAPEVIPQRPGSLLDALTPRELEVLRLIGEGLSNQAIADELVVSLNTIKRHSSNLYSKLGVHSRTQAIARAQELGML